MYSEKVMDHFTNPRNVGEIENPDGVGTVGNAKCGDIMRMYLDIDENGVIQEARFKTFGCGAAVATSSMATELVKGKTVEEALQQNSFAKIYLCIGINEMGTGTVESFLEAYQEAVNHLRELQPDAILYLQAIIKVTTERSNQGDYITNEGITARNEGIAQMADNEHIFFLARTPSQIETTDEMN